MNHKSLFRNVAGISLGVSVCLANAAMGQSRNFQSSANAVTGSGGRYIQTVAPQQTRASQRSSVLESNVFPLSDQLHGVARPSQFANLPSLVSGTIQTVHVEEGQRVTKGDPLITLDDRVPRARLEAATVEANLTGRLRRAQVDLRMAERRLSRLRSALHQGAGAAFELEEAEGVYDQAKAAVEEQEDILKAAEATRKLAEAQLAEYVIAAPFDGVITEIHQKSGAVDPSIVLVSIANLTTLQVEMHLPSRMFGHVKAGQNLPLLASSPVGGSLEAKVVSASPIIESASNTFRCLLDIQNPNTRLPAGFSVIVHQRNGQPVAAAMQ